MASNGVDPSTSMTVSLLVGNCHKTISRLVLLMTPWHGLYRKHTSQQFFYCCIMWLSLRPCREYCFPVSSLVRARNLLWPIPSNGHYLQSHYLAMGLHATIFKDSIPISQKTYYITNIMMKWLILFVLRIIWNFYPVSKIHRHITIMLKQMLYVYTVNHCALNDNWKFHP
jgi:hypothetical protein